MSVCSWWHPVVWILLLSSNGFTSPFGKRKRRIVTITNIILSLCNIISRHYKKSLLRSQILYTMDMKIYLWTQITLYEEDKKEDASMRCSLLHGSWDQIFQRRPSVCPASCVRSVAPTVLVGSISYLYILSSNFRRCVTCKVSCKISKLEFFKII